GRRYADDGADRERRHVVGAARPAHEQEDEAREQERRYRHPRDGVRRGADLAREARRHGHEEEAEDDDEDRAHELGHEPRVEEHRDRHDRRDEDDDPDPDEPHGEVPLGPGNRWGAFPPRGGAEPEEADVAQPLLEPARWWGASGTG